MKLTQSLLTLLASTSAPILLVGASPIFESTVINKGYAPVLSSTSASDHVIPNSYIVIFKKHVSEGVATQHHAWIQNVHEESVLALKKRGGNGYASGGGLLEGALNNVNVFSGLKHTYNIAGGMLGYSGHFDDSTLEQIRAHPDVSLIICRRPHGENDG